VSKKFSYEIQGKSLRISVADGRTEQNWTIRQTHSLSEKAQTLREVADALDPGDAPPGPQKAPQAGPVPPPVLGGLARILDAPVGLSEEDSLERLKARAYELAQQNLGLVADGHDTAVTPDQLPEINAMAGSGGNPHVYGMPALESNVDPRSVRQRPKVGSPNFRYEDTRLIPPS